MTMALVTLPLLIGVRRVLGLDPGDKTTGWAFLDPVTRAIIEMGDAENEAVLDRVSKLNPESDACGIEQMQNQGKRVGRQVFDACWWGGVYYHECRRRGVYAQPVGRQAAKTGLGVWAGGDAEAKRALVKIYGKLPGASSHMLAAVAVARKFAHDRIGS